MPYEIPRLAFSLPAGSDLSDESKFQYTAVKAAAGSGEDPYVCQPPGGTGAQIIGLLQNNPLLAEAASIMGSGISKAKLGASVTVGQPLMASTDANGAGVLVLATSGLYQVAVALESGVAGDLIAVLLQSNGRAA